MISSTLYHKFPTISYNGQLLTDLTVRLKFSEIAKKNLMVFYPYTVSEGERADTIAYEYYQDSSYAWLIYLANDIFDPLADWPKTSDQMETYIANKYGSIALAQQKILYYKVDWENDESMLNISGYNALPGALKKYWAPVFNTINQVTHFERKEVDWVIDTNKYVELQLTGDTTSLNVGDYVYQRPGGVKSAEGEVHTKNTDGSLIVKHVSGQFSNSSSVTVFGGDTSYGSCQRADVISNAFSSSVAIAADEERFWVPVTAYDQEININEAKKHIRLLDPSYLSQVERDITLLVTP